MKARWWVGGAAWAALAATIWFVGDLVPLLEGSVQRCTLMVTAAIGFIGWEAWRVRRAARENDQLLTGIASGSLAADSVRYADRIVIPYKPRMVVFYAGDNDVEANHTPQQIADDFTAFDRKVHAALPETQIVFISIKPSIRRFP